MAFFCSVTGVRIAAPGVCKDVDPVNGQDADSEVYSAPAKEVVTVPDSEVSAVTFGKVVSVEPAFDTKQVAKPKADKPSAPQPQDK